MVQRKIKRKAKRKVLVSEIKRSYKTTKNMKKTAAQTGASYQQVSETIAETRLTKRDRLYRNLLVKYNNLTRKEALLYITQTKRLHKKEIGIYGRPVTPWDALEY